MGFRIRKRIGFGPFRVNLSKQGASVSTRLGPLTLNSSGRATVRLMPGVSYSTSTRRRRR